ncbi:putative selenate ABC transporter substrate-binding protein [Limimaricola pyoseonensis]|uniref:Phosphonate transport system substrate-binding protein n=1 Tax=Limimaricola pyoseonensis TaxID=521013 RepID=A0A1G7K956_9RHOB|nr:putative selenate ABC transporter substrate-binding protein [Limimaricola pyoseonensis]SDF33590.1 phosphonate transport system substrate-binding protein [Limimaricola pyoseonensis]
MPTTRICALVLAALAAPAAAQDAPTLYFSAIPDNDETKLEARFGKVADYLEEALDVPVEYVPVKDYAASVTAFRNDQIQLAWFGGLSGVQARLAVPGSRAIAQGMEDETFVTYFIANAETGLAEPEDGSFPEGLEGRSFTFGSQSSTSGRLMPEYHLRRITGEAPRDLFSEVGFSGDHGQTLRLVASGAYDLGALNYTVYDEAVADGTPEAEATDIIWRTPPYPDYNWTIRGDVDDRWGEGFAERVQQALIALDDPEILDSFPRSGFIAADNDLYMPIEDTARELDLID